jgi:putative heme-binding domain-containing protein
VDQAGIWRLWPGRLKLEGFYGSEFEPQNPWGFVFTEWGEPIVLAGNNSSPIYPVPGLTSRHRAAAPTLIWKNGRGRKVSGGDIVGTRHFPDSWQGAAILGGYINNAVWAVKISDDGSGFSFEDLPPLIVTTNKSFRPVDVKFGPDGALYICDWYNPIIGHYQASFRHPDRDKAHGRIWRVTAKGRALTQAPRLADASIAELLNQLKSPDRWTRRFAKRVLADRPKEDVANGLKSWLVQPGHSDHDLVEALGVYQSHELVASELVAQLCRATNAGARAYAAGVIGSWADRLPEPLSLLRALVADENPRVRLQAVVACTYVPKAEAMEVALGAADLPTDKFLDYALNQAVFALKPYWLEPFKAGRLHLDNKAPRLSLLVRADATPDTLQAVRELAKSDQTDNGTRETYLRILTENGDGSDVSMILALQNRELQSRLLPAVATAAQVRKLRPAGDAVEQLQPLLGSSDPAIRAGALELVGLWKLNALKPSVVSALGAGQEAVIRRAAVRAIAALPGDTDRATISQLTKDGDQSVHAAAITALCGLSITDAARAASASLLKATDESAIQEIYSAFIQRQGGAAALSSALAQSAPSKHAAEIGLRLMNSAGRRDDQLARVLTQIAGLNTSRIQTSPAEMSALVSDVRTQGDPRRGAEIVRRPELGCMTCHSINGQGGKLGPDMSALGTAQPIDFIIGAILEPQKEIKEGFISISVTTKEGEEYQGYEVRETAEELVLRDVLQNREVRLRRDSIKERKLSGSVMPEGLTDTLSRTEFRDMIRYLSELGRPQ